jgi:hypothetical protein
VRAAARGAGVRHRHRQPPSLLADLALKEEGFGELLPGADAVIVDEAHQIPEIATQFFGIAVTQRQLLGLARDTEAEAMRCGAPALSPAELRRSCAPRGRRVWCSAWSRGGSCGAARRGMPVSRSKASAEALEVLTGDLDALVGASAGLDACRRRAVELSARLESVLGADDEQGLRWVEVFPQSFALHVTPLDAAGSLGRAMASRACAWVFTSATLAVGDDFSHFCGRVGLDDAAALRLDSPFDFERNALLCMPDGLPRSGCARLHAAGAERGVAAAPGESGPGLPPLHELPRAARGRGGARSPRLSVSRCSFREARRATSCCAASRSRQRRCCSARGASGKASTCAGLRSRSSSSTSCLSPRRAIRCCRRASRQCVHAAASLSMELQLPQAVIALKQGVVASSATSTIAAS